MLHNPMLWSATGPYSVSQYLSNWRSQIWHSISGEASSMPSRDSFTNLLSKLILGMWFPLLQALCWLEGSLAASQPLTSICTGVKDYHTPDAQLCSSCCPDLKFLLPLQLCYTVCQWLLMHHPPQIPVCTEVWVRTLPLKDETTNLLSTSAYPMPRSMGNSKTYIWYSIASQPTHQSLCGCSALYIWRWKLS